MPYSSKTGSVLTLCGVQSRCEQSTVSHGRHNTTLYEYHAPPNRRIDQMLVLFLLLQNNCIVITTESDQINSIQSSARILGISMRIIWCLFIFPFVVAAVCKLKRAFYRAHSANYLHSVLIFYLCDFCPIVNHQVWRAVTMSWLFVCH